MFLSNFLFATVTYLSVLARFSKAAAATTRSFSFNEPKDISDRSPCCVDRLTTLTCSRMRNNSPDKFSRRCINDPDFALIQCCSTCFDRRIPESGQRYNLAVRRHLEDPTKSTCIDRRGKSWCQRMLENSHGGCGAFPSAFRECRNTCGYCSATMQLTVVKYDFQLATNTKRCDIKTYFARTNDEMKKKQQTTREFDPLGHLSWKKIKSNDYFVVDDHNYDD